MAPANDSEFTARIHPRIADIDAAAWDVCAGGDNPFLAHAFLLALEESGSAVSRTGWAGAHLTIEDETGLLIGAMPLYLKGHSRGEYVFDYGWADAYERAGGQYYPKLLGAVPFTPATGPRLLCHPALPRETVRQALAQTAVAACAQLDASSVHINFLPREDWAALGELEFLQRTDQQFHWYNDSYGSFDDFLAALSSRKRKTIRRERREAQENGVEIVTLTGADITEEHWDAFYGFYMDTGSRKWGTPYLTREFFSLIGERMAEKVVLFLCRRAGRWIAGALNFTGSDCIYGRHWGCIEDHRFLHFETCYYRAIDYAIDHGLARVEAGAQGPHKLMRGYLPTHTYSAHWIRDSAFSDAVERYLKEERREVDAHIAHLSDYAPFRRDDSRLDEPD